MNKKNVLMVVCTLFLVTALICVPLTFAQTHWDNCKVSAYATNIEEWGTGDILFLDFTVAVPPSGSEIVNTLEVENYDGSENYTKTLSAGDRVSIRYDDFPTLRNSVEAALEEGHYIIDFEGEVFNATINSISVPEFSPILIVPMFIVATLLALAYRRKRTSQNQTTN